MKHLFIITYGRSGSTALLNILNSLPGYCIRGENGGIIIPMSQAIGRARWAKQEFGAHSTSKTSPWYGIDDIDIESFEKGMAAAFTSAILRPPYGTTCLGFKEIRYVSGDCSDVDFRFIVNFMLRVFENSRIIFLTRNFNEIKSSGWWKDLPEDDVRDVIESADSRFLWACEEHPTRTLLLKNEEFFGNISSLKHLLDWLGEEVDVDKIFDISKTRLTHLADWSEHKKGDLTN